MEISALLAQASIIVSILSAISLLVLHFVSNEFSPGWRMVSEYALGKHKWLLTSMFFCWGVSTICVGLLLFKIVNGGWASFGCFMIMLSGTGAIFGGLFDLKHKLHGLSFVLGVPTLPIGALIVSYHLSNYSVLVNHNSLLLAAAHSTWISILLMGISMVLLFSGLKKADIPVGPDKEPLEELPRGVIGINGYFNRLLILVYLAFNVIVSLLFLTN